jgi:uncharacterized protein YcbX
MPAVTELNLYPIKSCAGIALSSATVTRFGLMHQGVHDREWMVVDAGGNFLTQRELPKMACICPRITADGVEVEAPGMPMLRLPLQHTSEDNNARDNMRDIQVRVWDYTLTASDCGAACADWFSQFLGTTCRLVRFHAQTQRVITSSWVSGRGVQTLFADGFPILLISEGSLADLNGKLIAQGRTPLPMNRFRPNLVIDGVEAFEEDYTASLQIGNVQLQPVKPCPRCPMPSIDQATGIPGPDPLDILQSYRADPKVDGGITFGMNVILLAGENETLHLGQNADIELAF